MTRNRPPMIPLPAEPGRSPTPSPADHVRTLVELLRPAGPDLARRLVAALLLAPADEREAIVSSIETKMVELYAPLGADDPIDKQIAQTSADQTDDQPRMMNVIDPPVQRDGFVEQTIHTYEIKEDEPGEQSADGQAEITTRPVRPDIKAGWGYNTRRHVG